KVVLWLRRDDGKAPPAAFEAYRTERGYVVAIPTASIGEPGFSYWVVERGGGGSERALFASAAAPHHVRVTLSRADESERERMRERAGRRSTVIASAEWVDFGARKLLAGGATHPDRYYRLEAGYGYSFLRTVEDVQLTVVRVRGEAGAVIDGLGAPVDALGTPVDGLAMAVDSTELLEPGIDYGRAQVTLFVRDGIRLRGSTLLGASQKGFEYGGGGSMVLGEPEAASFTLGVEAITTLGATGLMRLGFAVTPALPMGASLELTSFPLGEDAGVRLLYDVGWAYAPGSAIVLRGGFQGRTSVTGGVSAGLSLRHAF
ncbi:MAG TPA: hypothetical protein VK509_21245, partial [Polyangiales bacterium]|nr:hypothetical protein [Polyangiales bacterium]